MAKGYMQEIRARILAMDDGSIFATSDFADIADTNTVRSALYRLVQDGILRRIVNGIFEKPKYSKLLDEYGDVPSFDTVMDAVRELEKEIDSL